MATIGTFKKSGEEYTGEIVTMSLQTKNVTIVPEATSDNDSAPSHRVYVGAAEIGAGWTKTTREDREYLGGSPPCQEQPGNERSDHNARVFGAAAARAFRRSAGTLGSGSSDTGAISSVTTSPASAPSACGWGSPRSSCSGTRPASPA